MNNSGQFGTLGVMFAVVIFTIFWVTILASQISEWGARYVELNSATGFEAFFYMNLNLWIGLCLLFVLLGAAVIGRE